MERSTSVLVSVELKTLYCYMMITVDRPCPAISKRCNNDCPKSERSLLLGTLLARTMLWIAEKECLGDTFVSIVWYKANSWKPRFRLGVGA